MPLCGKCHRDAPPGALFCAFCGGPIVPEPAAGEAADPHIGQTFKGMYFIQQKVGGGGMGQVYKAIHVTLDAPVALKILKKALLADPSVVQRFHREARAASRLRHPNVISVTDFGQTDDGTLFMAMEYVAGRSLAKVIAEDFPLSEQRVVHIAAQILAALAEAHAAQILHRDLKPENVMLEARRDEADSVKVLDFGIAKIQLPGDGRGTLTQAGLVCGTPGYMSPEQWSGEQLDARSDLYSVGVILYEMLTGKLPFEAETPMEMVRKHLTERPLPPSQRRADEVSPDLEALVMRALSARPADRPASAEEMRADLLACVLAPEPAPRGGGGPVKTMVMPKRPSSSPPARRPPSSPPAKQPAAPAPSPEDLEAQPTRLAPAVAARTPVSTALPAQPGTPARPPTPAGPRRPPTGPGSAGRTPPPARRGTPVPGPRHEEDEPEGEEQEAPAAPRRSKVPLIAGAAVAAVALAAVLALVLREPEAPPPPPLAVTGTAPASVPADGGTPVVVSGTGFGDGVRVSMGGSEAAVTAASAAALQVTAPAHPAGPADVVVTAPDGRRATLPAGITFVAPTPPAAAAPPRLQAASPDAGPASGGTAVTLSGAGFASGARVTFGGAPAQVSASSAGSLTVAAPAHEPGAVEVAVVNPDGQRSALPEGYRYEAAARPGPPRKPAAPPRPPRSGGKVVAVKDALNAIPTPAAVTGDGVISVQVEPYGDVFVDDRPYGEAPRELRVAAGTYVLKARNPALGQREHKVTVKAGERVRWIADLTKRK